MILAAVLLIPVALGAGEKNVASPLNDEEWTPALTVNFKTPTGFEATTKLRDLDLVTHAPSVFGKRTKRHANCSLRLWRA